MGPSLDALGTTAHVFTPERCGHAAYAWMEEQTLTASDLSGIVQRKVLQPNDFDDLAALEERLLASSATTRRSPGPNPEAELTAAFRESRQ
jgi:hypothetical protein